jgi:hypothetical protein
VARAGRRAVDAFLLDAAARAVGLAAGRRAGAGLARPPAPGAVARPVGRDPLVFDLAFFDPVVFDVFVLELVVFDRDVEDVAFDLAWIRELMWRDPTTPAPLRP